MSSVLWFKDFNVFCFMIYKTSFSPVLWFSKTSMSSTLYFHRTQCPLFLSFIGLNVLVLIFHRTQCPCFYAFEDPTSSVSMLSKTSNVFCSYAIGLQCPPFLCFVGLQGPLFDVTRLQHPFSFFDFASFVFSSIHLKSWIARVKLVSLSLLIFYFQ